ncbi:MAG TPA: hypothetical protein VLS94_08970 [Fusibacter sp.]|nr:hypothetical protein [Fusibacter sp.]
MNYCVVKNTISIIDGSENSKEIMINNAKQAGFDVLKIEILTKEQFEKRLKENKKCVEISETQKLWDIIGYLINSSY